MFAYGLSGSGKTYTVFGPDAADSPDAWFKQAEPHSQWGIFPHLAYELFQERQDGWALKLKYFQNVVDIVRDLMSPSATEQHYKSGMRKDDDGFMDIDWCGVKVLKDWDDLRSTFKTANARKAISPTQFNHQSTRGHCIMTLEVEKPKEDDPSTKQRGRVYVCDLAGTEPAGDIYAAQYEKKKFPDGTFEMILKGKHPNQSKTKELQDQGKKINLSLSEMAQFFMKMAEAVKAKKLKPGTTIPGCNSYFLCKYLKDTVVCSKTYLFCAVRPEVKYHQYTYSTCKFAANASVIKLTPKKATTGASAAERKLMQELEAMKELVKQLQKEKAGSGGGGGGADPAKLNLLQGQLADKQAQLESVLAGAEGAHSQDAIMEAERTKYARRGMALAHFERDTELPHLINMDVDSFLNERFMYILEQGDTVMGPGGDIAPMTLSVVRQHCTFNLSGSTVKLCGGAGATFVNGKEVPSGNSVVLNPYDRVAIGGELLLFRSPGRNPKDVEPMSPDDAVEEYQRTLLAGADGGAARAIASGSGAGRRGLNISERAIGELLAKCREMKDIMRLLDRDMLSFEVAASGGTPGTPSEKDSQLMVKVTNASSRETVYLEAFEFNSAFNILRGELVNVKNALDSGGEYELPLQHDPIVLLYDVMFPIGAAVMYPEYLAYMLDTDDDERMVSVYSGALSDEVKGGQLDVNWTPVIEGARGEIPEIDDESELLGKPWTYRLDIQQVLGLPIKCDEIFVQYDFFGEPFASERLNLPGASSVTLNYSCEHQVPCVTQAFLDWLKKPLAFQVFVSPTVEKPARSVGTSNMAVAAAVRSWNPMLARATSMKSGLSAEKTAELQKLLASLEDENQRLRAEGRKLKSTNKVLASTCAIERKRVKRLTEQVRLYSGGSTGQARWQGAEMALKESKAGSSAACSIQ